LAIGEESNYKVGTGIHIRGKIATEFIAEYFMQLWNFASVGGLVFRLKEESQHGVNQSELERLHKALVEAEHQS
jgi:hypothetical protein